MKKLHHKGILVPPLYEVKGLTIALKGREIMLTTEQEEMAMAWAKKVGTPYVEDPVFAKNFHRDFSKKLGIEVEPGDVDYSDVIAVVEKERELKASLSIEAKKLLAAQRKAAREENKEHYGYAVVDDKRMELANYFAEPSSIFMGRGEHPLRGSWKEGPREEDIVLNLSPDAPKPEGNWKEIVWEPELIWVARWQDKLCGKMKYVWFSDSSELKQRKDIEKFDKAKAFRRNLLRVQKHIRENLDSEDLKRRKIATVCFLIDELKIRVGDEKDPDEADTVGASTLRPEHISFNGNGTITFNFLGKDCVPHVFTKELPENVIRNLKEFAANAEATLFDGVRSQHVSAFLDEVMTGLSAKVFRTLYASDAVKTKLKRIRVEVEEPEYRKKYVATMANLEAAKVCNHKRTIPKRWKASLEKKKDRLKVLKKQAKQAQVKLKKKATESQKKHGKQIEKHEQRLRAAVKKLENYNRQLCERKREDKSVEALKKRIKSKRKAIAQHRQRIKALKVKQEKRMKKLKQTMEKRKRRDRAAVEKMKLKVEIQGETRDYNLTTSLKSYIDPRIYYEWGKKVEYNWKLYYPQTLQKKFSWVDHQPKKMDG